MQTPQQYAVVTGADAARVYEAINGINAPSQLEAILTAPDSGEIVMFLSIREGYVRFDDWGDVDADSMLKEIKDGTEEANATRQAAGQRPSAASRHRLVGPPGFGPRRADRSLVDYRQIQQR